MPKTSERIPLPTKAEFASALKRMQKPGRSQLRFLQEHVRAPGRALTATCLAQVAGYRNHGGINLQYGLLAKRIREEIGRTIGPGEDYLSLLVDFVRPRSVTNTEWVMVMHPQFADALKEAGWV